MAIIAAVAGTIGLTACGGDDDESGGTDAAFDADVSVMEASAPAATDAPAAADDSGVPTDPAGPAVDLGTIGRDVIIEMHVLMSSDDIGRSVASITADASALGGGVASSDIDYGQPAAPGVPQSGHAVVVVKVPPQAVQRLMRGLDTAGEVVSINQSAQDVTEQLVDLEVRIANARQSVANVRQFMDATTNLGELVTLESELTRRQTELEQLEAQQRNLGERVAMSTITIEIVPTAAVPVAEPEEGIGDAFRNGWEAFVAMLFGVVFVLAVLAPFIALGAVVGFVVWQVARVRRSSTVRSPLHPAGTDQPKPMPAPPTVSDEPADAASSVEPPQPASTSPSE